MASNPAASTISGTSVAYGWPPQVARIKLKLAQPMNVDPCSQSQIERDCHLQRQRTAQVKTGMALSVVVRWRPVRAFVNGTLVARPARTTFTAWQ